MIHCHKHVINNNASVIIMYKYTLIPFPQHHFLQFCSYPQQRRGVTVTGVAGHWDKHYWPLSWAATYFDNTLFSCRLWMGTWSLCHFLFIGTFHSHFTLSPACLLVNEFAKGGGGGWFIITDPQALSACLTPDCIMYKTENTRKDS